MMCVSVEMEKSSVHANSGSSGSFKSKRSASGATCSAQSRTPVDRPTAVAAGGVSVLVGSSTLRSPFPPQFQAHSVSSSMAPIHMIGASSHYIPQVAVTHIRDTVAPAVVGPGRVSCSSLSPNRFGYFPQVASSITPTLIPRGPQLTPSAFIAGSHSAPPVACPLPTPDAMGYLEQVKTQFASKPQVYNEFLEAMKGFKDQTLDLLGVIKRIGALFVEFPHLISGFNTFLPHGYRLDVSNDRAERIIVYSPTAKLHSFSEDELLQERQSFTLRHLEPSGVYRPPENCQTREDTCAAPESSSAIAYVNKIKIRFQSQPAVYQQFLEILQSYQKEQQEKPTNSSGDGSSNNRPSSSSSASASVADARVFSQLAKLFANDKDLLDEFTSTSSGETAESVVPSAATITDDGSCQEVAVSSESSAADSNQICLRSRGRRKRTAAVAAESASVCVATRKRARPASSAAHTLPSERNMTTRTKNSQQRNCQERDHAKESCREISFEKYMFIEKLRYALNSDELYTGLLCVLKLFNLCYLQPNDVQEIVHCFVGNQTDLTEWFSKEISQRSTTNAEVSLGQSGGQKQERTFSDGCPNVDFRTCKQFGVSYRLIPTIYQNPKCSGRTPLGAEVLNFKYLSFPTWQSEENPTVAMKRSPYEEALFTTEDERFEADIVIAVNRCLMDAFSDAMEKMRMLSKTELRKFRLDETLNTRSLTIAQRALRLVFHRSWQDFYTCALEIPRKAIELILKILTLKNNEWHNNLPSMNRAWHELNEKSYWKALDYQYATFKQQDLKSIRTRALLNHIEALFEERRSKAKKENRKIPSGPHIVTKYPASEVAFYDVGDLVVHYVKRQTNINPACKCRITRIVKVLLPALFYLQPEKLSDTEVELESRSTKTKSSGSKSGPTLRGGGRGRCRGGWRRRGGRIPCSGKGRGAKVDDEGKTESVEDLNIVADLKLLRAMPEYSVMFMPSPWFVFLRLHCILSERLTQFYDICCELVAKRGQADSQYLYQTKVLRNRFADKKNVEPKHLYSQLVNLTKHWLDGSIDCNTYEDAVRDVFTLHAYRAFTIMKIIQIMSRQLQLMVTDITAVKAFKLYESWNSKICWTPDVSKRQQLDNAYQAEAMSLMAQQNCFKIVFGPNGSGTVSYEMLNTFFPDDNSDQGGVSDQRTDACQSKINKCQFLQRNVQQASKYIAKELANREARGRAGRNGANVGASRTPLEIARSAGQFLYWQRSGTSEAVRNGHSFSIRVYKKFWNVEETDREVRSPRGENFCAFHEQWLLENVSKEKCREINEMLMGSRKDKKMMATWMRRSEEPCSRRPPYYAINRYTKYHHGNDNSSHSRCSKS
uniref:HDAC_interact domain-containing protein n=1 Tax=Trichuris muris TaxID=70415 RepID=A0A5S6QB12_TRIMR